MYKKIWLVPRVSHFLCIHSIGFLWLFSHTTTVLMFSNVPVYHPHPGIFEWNLLVTLYIMSSFYLPVYLFLAPVLTTIQILISIIFLFDPTHLVYSNSLQAYCWSFPDQSITTFPVCDAMGIVSMFEVMYSWLFPCV